jgi:hypothetical protein
MSQVAQAASAVLVSVRIIRVERSYITATVVDSKTTCVKFQKTCMTMGIRNGIVLIRSRSLSDS